jgi:hypothetical protein
LGQVRLLIALCLGMLSLGDAYAFPAESLQKAREAIANGKRRDARNALDAAHLSFLDGESVVLNDVLARYWFYRGLVAKKRGKKAATMEAFRQTLLVDRSFQWDRDLVDDLEMRKMFEALRGEVEGRDVHPAKVPEGTGCAVLYVDGSQIAFGDQVSVGERLAQIQCPKGDVYGAWSDFDEEEPFNWLAMCPYEVDTSIEILAKEQPQDDFAEMGPSFGSPAVVSGGPCAAESAPPPTSDGDGMAGAEAPVEEEAQASDEVPNQEPAGTGFFSKELWSTRRVLVAGTGVALLGGGVGFHYGAVVPSFSMVEWGRRNSRGITRYQADILTGRFRMRRAVSWGLMGAGAVTTGVGLVLFKPSTNLTVQPILFPGGGGLRGQF